MAVSINTKVQNTISILKFIRKQGDITKPALGALSGLTASTVHGIINHLEGKGVIYRCGISASNGGRNASLYRINKDYKYIIAVCIRVSSLKIGLVDFDLNMIEQKNMALSLGDLTVEQVIEKTAAEITAFTRQHALAGEKIAGIGLNVPGPVDSEGGIVYDIASVPQWRNIPLRERLQSVVKLPVYLEKDLYSGMQYLSYINQPIESSSTVCLSVCDGIACGILIDGKVYRGQNALAGEIGHISVKRDGKKCRCGTPGCLEVYASDVGIVAHYNSENPTLTPKTDVGQIVKQAERGDKTAKNIFNHATKLLAETVSNIILMYDPKEILINCSWLQIYRSSFFSSLDKQFEKSAFSNRGPVSINLLQAPNFYLLGAAAIVAEHELFFANSPLYQNEVSLF